VVPAYRSYGSSVSEGNPVSAQPLDDYDPNDPVETFTTKGSST
jgi:hypothetical protein